MTRTSPRRRSFASKNEAERLAHNAFCERYAFWKKRGQALTPAARIAAVAALLGDDRWLRTRYNSLLSRVVEDIEEAISTEAFAAWKR